MTFQRRCRNSMKRRKSQARPFSELPKSSPTKSSISRRSSFSEVEKKLGNLWCEQITLKMLKAKIFNTLQMTNLKKLLSNEKLLKFYRKSDVTAHLLQNFYFEMSKSPAAAKQLFDTHFFNQVDMINFINLQIGFGIVLRI